MKKMILPIIALSMVQLISCTDNPKDKTTHDSNTAANADSNGSGSTVSEPKSFTLTFTPDTVILGKNKELLVKILNGKGVELLDPDGKDQGIQVTFDLDVTSRNKVGGNGIFFRTDNFRLTLDNGNNITESKGGAETVDPESTKEYKEITYKLPAGTKPTTLNLYHDETRVSVTVDLK